MKLKVLFFGGCFFLIFSFANSQKLNSKELMRAWNESDVNQTIKAEATYKDLTDHFDEKSFLGLMKELNLNQKTYSKRLKARVIIYETLGKRLQQHDIIYSESDLQKIRDAMQLAAHENDEQLLSEIFTLYAEALPSSEIIEKKLLYTLKAIEIQRKIGFQYFPLIHLRFLTASITLYNTGDYRESIKYGKEFLNSMDESTNPKSIIFQYDFLGASYREINEPDSSIYYYNQIQNLLKKEKSFRNDQFFSEVWKGVASGGIGQALVLKGENEKAVLLLTESVELNRKHKQFSAAANAENTLAQIYFKQGNSDKALSFYKTAYAWSVKGNDLRNKIKSLEGISRIFHQENRFDSAFHYSKLYHINNDSLILKINKNNWSAINAQVEMDNVKALLQNAEQKILTEKYIRNFILLTVILLGIIGFLFYKRKQLKLRLREERLQMETQYAQQQIENFTQNISEKNKLIESLQSQIGSTENSETNLLLMNFTVLTEENWQDFKVNFEKVNPGFWNKLNQKMPGLTTAEQRIMLFARLGFSNKEMAAATGVSTETIRSVISRLRKKFEMGTENDIRTVAREI